MIDPSTFNYLDVAVLLAKRFKSPISETKIRIKIHEYFTNSGIDYTLEDSQWLFNQLVVLEILEKVKHSERTLKVELKCGGNPPRGDIKYKVHKLRM